MPAHHGAGTFPAGTLLETFKTLVPDFASYLGQENINDCGGAIREGECRHIDYHWGTAVSVPEILTWYKSRSIFSS